MLINKYDTPKLKLKIINNILSIPSLPIELMKETYEFLKIYRISIINIILTNPYELITFENIRYFTTYLKRMLLTEHPLNKLLKYDVNKVNIQDNNIIIDKYILSPFTTYKSNSIELSYTYFFYYAIHLNKKIQKKILIFKLLLENELEFSLENYLIQHNHSLHNITTIFITNRDIDYIDNGHHYKIINYNQLNIKELDEYLDMYDNVYIGNERFSSKYNSDDCYYDILNLPYLLFILTMSLNHLKKKGDLFIFKSYPMLSYSYLSLFYYVFTLFNSMEFYHHDILVEKVGLFHLKNYNGKSKLNTIFSQYYKIDPELSLNTYIDLKHKIKNDSIECYVLHPKNIKIFDKFIYSVTDIHPEFINFIYNIYLQHNKRLSIFIEHFNSIQLKNIHSILSYNIQICKDFCNQHNIEIEDYYKYFKPLTYKKILKEYFIHKPYISYNNLKLNTDSIYSITLPDDSKKMVHYIQHIFPYVNTIIDGTSNIGSNTIVMAYHFEKIIACEIDKTTFEYLKNNINEYKLKNVELHHDSIVSHMKKNEYDLLTTCLYLDPPWSGIHYKSDKIIDLYLDDLNVIDFIKEINIKYITLKVPSNYNFNSLDKLNVNDIQIYHLSSFYFILLVK